MFCGVNDVEYIVYRTSHQRSNDLSLELRSTGGRGEGENGFDRASEIDVEASNYIRGKRKIQLTTAPIPTTKKLRQYDNHSE